VFTLEPVIELGGVADVETRKQRAGVACDRPIVRLRREIVEHPGDVGREPLGVEGDLVVATRADRARTLPPRRQPTVSAP
jgi:hypothetical protein